MLGTLRVAHHPMTTDELASHVMAERDLSMSDERLLRTVSKYLGACLRHHRNSGVLQSAATEGGRMLWKVTLTDKLIEIRQSFYCPDETADVRLLLT